MARLSFGRQRMRENPEALEFELEPADGERIDAITTRRRVIDRWPGAFERGPDVFGD